MNKLYWVGPRESDIEELGSIFTGSVTIYGSNRGNNRSFCQSNAFRINHNEPNVACDAFIQAELKKLIHMDESVNFLFYNASLVYDFDCEIAAHSICVNNRELLTQLNDKARCRRILQQVVTPTPFVTLSGKECVYNNIRNYFKSEDFVIQDNFSSGGEGTFHIRESEPLDFIEQDKRYLVSPYIKDGLSVNAHIIISSNNILFFPPSVQIISEIDRRLLYFGADYICYTSVDSQMQRKVKDTSISIGKYLQTQGYRGVMGIDFLLKDENLYFMEINPRFQASSQLLNMAMKTTQQASLQELHILSFGECHLKDIVEFSVPYSNYTYMTNNIHANRIPKMINSQEVFKVQEDGFEPNTALPVQENIYLFRCIFNTNISSISQDKLLLHPNIYTEDITPYMQSSSMMYKPNVKIALLNHGVNLTPKALEYAGKCGTIRKAVFDAIDIVIFESLYINVPLDCKFCTFSPFFIEYANGTLFLSYNGNYISNVEISYVPELLLDKKTASGVPFDNIINLANDRIRINPAPVCVFKKLDIACKFCNLPEQNSSYNIEDIKETIDYCLETISFRHFLIGGGTYSLQGGWNIITEIASYIRSKSDKRIYLMSIPPSTTKTLTNLYNAGITEVAFNMEIFDRTYALQIMPGKGKITAQNYFSVFAEAVKIWGNTGNVRSLLIYGFDSWDTFLQGIKTLCEKGVEPIISIFRPLKGTPLEDKNPPPTVELFSLYKNCQDIAHQHSLILGPDCVECQNNTLSYTEQ
ncbi:MAG: ATP-grasp domain-containing protein [Lachnospiraceae bacterium]|nr:ATP-grasp domain-containing protein [Lachnospiraceae bacterium]